MIFSIAIAVLARATYQLFGEEFLQLLESVSIPVLIILAENAPPKSKAEMEAMAELAKVQTVQLEGTLGIFDTPTAKSTLDS